MKPCEIVQDLLPLYVENMCSEESRTYVEEHLKECAECRLMHEAMIKSVQVIHAQRKSKSDATRSKRRILTPRGKNILLIVLCALMVFIPIGFFVHDKIMLYLYRPLETRIAPVISDVTEMSDGSIYVKVCYTEEDVYINNPQSYQYSDDPSTLYIKLGSSPVHNIGRHPKKNNLHWHEFMVSTEESYAKYKYPLGEIQGLNYPYTRIILRGTDGERVLWEAGDELLPAPIQAEAQLQSTIDSRWFVPVQTEVPAPSDASAE